MDWPVAGAVAGVGVSAAVLAATIFALSQQGEPGEKAALAHDARAPLLLTEHAASLAPPSAPRPAPGPFSIASAPSVLSPEPLQRRPSFHVDPYEGSAEAAPKPAAPPHKVHRAPQARKAAREPERETAKPEAARREHETAKAPAPKPHPEPPKVDHRYDGVLTTAEIVRIRNALHLTPEQRMHWPPVEAQLRMIGHQQMRQINGGQKPEVSTSAVQSLYFAAQPLLAMLTEQQKEVVRRLARSVGYASVASMI